MSSSYTDTPPPSPRRELIPILHGSHQVVLYNPTSHAVSIREHEPTGTEVTAKSRALFCPYCDRPFDVDVDPTRRATATTTPGQSSRAHNYFQLLEIANESSRPSSPSPSSSRLSPNSRGGISSGNLAEGYFVAFFREECRLGMGANGTMHLARARWERFGYGLFHCHRAIDNRWKGRFAVKKIAVGQSQDYLLNTLREVRLLETLHHPNIVTYHHSWLETCRFSSFGPAVPTLFILMQWAEGGSLDDFIRMRLGIPPSQNPEPQDNNDDEHRSRSSRIRAFRSAQIRPEVRRAQREDSQRAERGRAIHFLNATEIKSIFNDVVSGLGFLHAKAILHLDLKPGNVLLTYDEGRLIPRAMLSDFGTYQDMLRPHRARTGITGTLEYTAPESLSVDINPSSKSDMWSLGMILHILLFFRLPYDHVEDSDIMKLEREVVNYKGFKTTLEITGACKRRGIPRAALILLEELLTINPRTRPSCEQILAVLREGKLDPLNRDSASDEERGTLVPVVSVQQQQQQQRDISPPRAVLIQGSDSSSLGSDTEPLEERKPLLSLPAPPSQPPPLVTASPLSQYTRYLGLSPVSRWIDRKTPGWVWGLGPGKLIKSTVLVLKIMSLSQLCRNIPSRPIVLCGVVVLAVLDVWTDRLSTSAVLGLMHLSILSLGRSRCCMY